MVKFYEEWNGLGMYMYFLIFDQQGNNIFDDGGDLGIDKLCYVVVGCLVVMFGLILLFVLYENSYDWLVLNVYVLMGLGWVYENCILVICILLLGFKVWWIEYCVVGGDVNFYLMVVVIFGVVLNGLEDGIELLLFIYGNVYEQGLV